MNRFTAIGSSVVLAAAVAVGAGAFLLKANQRPKVSWGARVPHGARTAARDRALLRVLPGGPSASQIASGVLTGSNGAVVTTVRASTKTCRTANAFDSAQVLTGGDYEQSAFTDVASFIDSTMPAPGLAASSRIVDSAFTGFHGLAGIQPAPSLNTSAPWSASAYLHAGTSHYAGITEGAAGQGCVWNLDTGAQFYKSGPGSCSSVSAGGGWWRVTLTSTGSGGVNDNVYILNNPSAASSATPQYLGAGAYFWAAGVKAEAGSTATAYVPGSNQLVKSLSSNQPCVEAQGLLVEGASTNLALHSGDMQNAWTLEATSGSIVATANACIAPDGTLTGTRFDYPAQAPGLTRAIVYQSLGSTGAGTAYSASVYARAISGEQRIEVFLKGAGTTSDMCTGLSSSWTRCVSTRTAAGVGANYLFIGYDELEDGSKPGPFLATSVCLWGVQAEAQPFATSYIPTVGTASARAADVVSVPNPLPNTPDPWCVYATVTPENGGGWNVGNGAAWELGTGHFATNTAFSQARGDIYVYTWVSGATVGYWYAYSSSSSFANGSTHRLGQCVIGTTISQSFDGVLQGAATGGTAVAQSGQGGSLFLGSFSFNGQLFGYLSDVCVGPPGACR